MSKLSGDLKFSEGKLDRWIEKYNRFIDHYDKFSDEKLDRWAEKFNRFFDYYDNFKKKWKAITFLPEKARILLNYSSRFHRLIKWSISIVAVSLILGFFGQGIYLSYQSNKLLSGLLYAELSPQDTHQIGDFLTERSIIYKISNDSTSVKVPENDVHLLRMALAREGLPERGQILTKLYAEIEDHHATLETDLEKTLSIVEEIRQPRVYIIPALTDPNEEISAPAFVLLSLESISNDQLKSDLIGSIIRLISATVHGIDRDQITLLDGTDKPLTEVPLSADLITFLHSQYWTERKLQKQVRGVLKDRLNTEYMEIFINAPLISHSTLPVPSGPSIERQIARITATVILDEIHKTGAGHETVTATIEKALNLDTARGDKLTVLYIPFDRTRELKANQEAAIKQRKEFWTSVAINVAKLLGIFAALITLRFIIQAVGRGAEMRKNRS